MAYEIDIGSLPEHFPTHKHDPAFWEALGRTVATYGFLEEVLKKAIYCFTGTTPYTEEDFSEWVKNLELMISDPFGSLVNKYEKSLKENPNEKDVFSENLVASLRESTPIRNALCHGSWRTPNECGSSTMFYVDKRRGVFETSIDMDFLCQNQRAVAELACRVIESVTRMGWQFPGSQSPGVPIWK